MKKWFTILGILSILRVMAKTNKPDKEFYDIVPFPQVRPCDPAGCGYFGAPRTNHTHQGVDVVSNVGEPVYAAISGRVRIAYPYRNSREMKGIEVINGDTKVKAFYVDPIFNTGDYVNAGEIIGYTQDIAGYYNNPNMTNHIHVEVRINNKIVDPTPYIIKNSIS